MDSATDFWPTNSSILEISDTDWCVCGAPSWLSAETPTFSLSTCSLWSATPCVECQMNRYLSYFSSLRRLRSFRLLLGNFCLGLCAVYPLRDKIFYQYMAFFIERHIYTRNSAIADKPRDAFRGRSRSPNMIPFHMLRMVSYYCAKTLSGFLRYLTSKMPWPWKLG